jgi:hypothetical protein
MPFDIPVVLPLGKARCISVFTRGTLTIKVGAASEVSVRSELPARLSAHGQGYVIRLLAPAPRWDLSGRRLPIPHQFRGIHEPGARVELTVPPDIEVMVLDAAGIHVPPVEDRQFLLSDYRA